MLLLLLFSLSSFTSSSGLPPGHRLHCCVRCRPLILSSSVCPCVVVFVIVVIVFILVIFVILIISVLVDVVHFLWCRRWSFWVMFLNLLRRRSSRIFRCPRPRDIRELKQLRRLRQGKSHLKNNSRSLKLLCNCINLFNPRT